MDTLLPYMRKYRIYAFLCPLLMILEVLTDIIVPYLMSKIVNIGIKNHDIGYIIKIGLLMIGVALVGMFFGILSAHYGARAGFGFAAEIREETFKKIQDFSFSNLESFTVSSLITRLTNDCNTIGQVTMMSLRMAIRSPFMMIFAFIMAFKMNASLAKVFMISIPIASISILIILSKTRPLFLKFQTKVDKVNAVIKENLTAMEVVKSFNRQDYEKEKFRIRNDELRNIALEAISLIVLLMPILNLIIFGTIIAVLWFGGQQIIHGVMGSGDLIAFITYITQILIALVMLSMFFMQFLRGSASVKRILELWGTESEIKEIDKPISKVKDGSIEFKDVSFCYSDCKELTLKNIDLSIESGEVIGIIGSTGSSKSTLVQLIPRLYDVLEGSVKVGGIDVRDYDIEVLRDEVAFVLQRNTLFSGTIRENMKWGDQRADDEKIISALKAAQAWEFVSKYEDGLDHRVAQGGNNFSGGQRQRLTIARALMKNPKIIILDDSTSAVDMDTEVKIQRAFEEGLGHITIIVIAQRISSIKNASRIIVMHEGQIEAMGSHNELIEESPIYKEIYDSQEKGVVGE